MIYIVLGLLTKFKSVAGTRFYMIDRHKESAVSMNFVGKTYIRLSLLSLSFPFRACGLAHQAKRLVSLTQASTWGYSIDLSLTKNRYFDHIWTCKASKLRELLVSSAATKLQQSCGKLPLLSPATGFAGQKTVVDVQLETQETSPFSTPICVKYNMADNLEDSGVVVSKDLPSHTHDDLSQMDVDSQVQGLDSKNLVLDSLSESSVVGQEDSGFLETDLPQVASGLTGEKRTVLPESLLAQVTNLVKHGEVSTDGGGTTDGKAVVPSKKKTKKLRENKKDNNKGDETTEFNVPAEGSSSSQSLSSHVDAASSVVQEAEGDDQLPVEHIAKFHTGRKKIKKKITESSKPHRAVPTHFICIQINDPQIHSGMAEVQKSILAVEKKMEVAMVSTATAHLTLMVMRLDTDEDVKRAGNALDKCVQDNWSNYSQGSEQLGLEVCGLGHFHHTVLFAKVSPGPQLEELQKIAESVESCLADDNVPKADPKPFKPHITLMKFSGERGHILRKQGIKKIDPSLYERFTDHVFGSDTVRSLQLCSMNLPKDEETGYYHIEHEVSFGLFGNGNENLSPDSQVNLPESAEESAGRLDDPSLLSVDSEKSAIKAYDQSVLSGYSEKSAIKGDDQSVLSGYSEKSATKFDSGSVLSGDPEKSAIMDDDQSVLSGDSEKSAIKAEDLSVLSGDSEKSAIKAEDQSVLSGDSEKSAIKGDDQSVLGGHSGKSATKCDNDSVLSGDSEESAIKGDGQSVISGETEKSGTT